MRAWDDEDFEAQGRQLFAQEILDVLEENLSKGVDKLLILAKLERLCVKETEKKI